MGERLVHPDRFLGADQARPATPIEALMIAATGHEPQESALEREVRRDRDGIAVRQAMAFLDDTERKIVEGIVLEGASLRELATRFTKKNGKPYGKSWVALRRDAAFAKLRLMLDPNHEREQ